MPLPHMRVTIVALGILKAATVVGSVLGVALFTMNPGVEIALIVTTPGIMAVILNALKWRDDNRKHDAAMKVMTTVATQTDGINSKLFAEKNKLADDKAVQAVQLSETAQKLSHAEGVQQERVDERGRQNDAK